MEVRKRIALENRTLNNFQSLYIIKLKHGRSQKHHFVPKFLLKPWTYDEKNLWLYLKSNIEVSPRSASIADVGHEKNLYTSRGGDKSVETDFLVRLMEMPVQFLKYY